MLTGIFHAVAVRIMQREFLITFVTAVTRLTADSLFYFLSRREYYSSRSVLLQLITAVTALKRLLTSNTNPKILHGSLPYVTHLL
jgi:hypothetical protein